MSISYELINKSKRVSVPHDEHLPFGALRTDHMFVAEYEDGEWKNARIVPYGTFSIMPGSVVLHYGQTIFEGAKAFRHPDGEIYLFRIDENIKRLNHSADILCMPHMPADLHLDSILRLIDVERAWCPSVPEYFLYIRPFMFGTQIR